MEEQEKIIEPLLERVEQYGKTSFELLKLKSIDKTSDLLSTLFSQLLLIFVFSFFVILLNIGIAIWLGTLLGEAYLGFLVVAIFYFILGLILLMCRNIIKGRLYNSIISKLAN